MSNLHGRRVLETVSSHTSSRLAPRRWPSWQWGCVSLLFFSAVDKPFDTHNSTRGCLRLRLQPRLRFRKPSTRTVVVFRGASPPAHAAG